MPQIQLSVRPETLSLYRFSAPPAIDTSTLTGFWQLTRRDEEYTLICQSPMPNADKTDAGWRALQVDGVLDFSLIGILSAISSVLAEAGISIFACSTYDTDVILIQQDSFQQAITALTQAGYSINQ